MANDSGAILVNDVHSALNATRVRRVLEPAGLDALVEIVASASAAAVQLSLCGSRHAMGGQQFGANSWLLDLRRHSAIRSFDQEHGLITVDAGIQWRELIDGYTALQEPGGPTWSIRQKQTGADRLTLGGALSANIHGRGLRLAPIVGDVEAFTLIDANADVWRCSRMENPEMFSLAIGGYGMFGLIAEVTLRLMRRAKVERRVEILTLDELVRVPEERDTADWLFGDFQYSLDERSPDFLRRGVFSAYHRLEDDAHMPAGNRNLSPEDWRRLLHLAHTDRALGFEEYARHYRLTHGQRYWSDTHQLGDYLDGHHEELDRALGAAHRGSEMITEIYVPRTALAAFMGRAADLLRGNAVPVIYGTIRLIERDEETVLAWARKPWACIVFNLHVEHTSEGIDAAQAAFRGLIDLAVEFDGSYYLTYHRWAMRAQVEACHPNFREFLRQKARYDPKERFTSEWYRHHRRLFAESA